MGPNDTVKGKVGEGENMENGWLPGYIQLPSLLYEGNVSAQMMVPKPSHYLHWNKNVVILTKFSSLAALDVVILTTSSAASDEHFIKMKTFPFQCNLQML